MNGGAPHIVISDGLTKKRLRSKLARVKHGGFRKQHANTQRAPPQEENTQSI